MTIKKKYKALVLILLVLALAGVFYTYFIQIRHVKAGEIGIKASLGSPIDNAADFDIKAVKGYVVFMPLYTDLVIYPTTIQIAVYDSITVPSKDGVQFRIKPSISYQLDETKVQQFYKSLRLSLSDVSRTYLKEIVSASYVSASNTFTADSLTLSEARFDSLANSILRAKMEDIGLILKNTISNMEYPESIKKAVTLRVKAQQDVLVAERKLIEIDVVRKEDSLRYSSLTPLAIQKMFIDKWDGKMPAYGGEISRIYDSISKK